MSITLAITPATREYKPTDADLQNYCNKQSTFVKITNQFLKSQNKDFQSLIDDATANLAEAEARVGSADLCIIHIKNINDSGLKDNTIKRCRELLKEKVANFNIAQLDLLESKNSREVARKICDPTLTKTDDLFER
jgi:hypothetical protein